jgi:hypothetical protein
MAIDKLERAYSKDKSMAKKQSEPFVMLGSEMLNSLAYRDLSFSARSMLIEVLHYYSGKNNGRIWLAPLVLSERGFSKNTSSRALKELREHGFIYMTKRGGNQRGGCSWFALTWLKIDKAEGQHLESFKKSAYLFWEPKPKKIKGSNFGIGYPKFGALLGKGSQSHESKEILINAYTYPILNSQQPKFDTYKDIAIYRTRNNQIH